MLRVTSPKSDPSRLETRMTAGVVTRGRTKRRRIVLVVPNWENLEKWARIKNLIWTQRSQLLEMPIVHAKIEKEVYGRPVGVALMHDGSLLVADEPSNIVWRVSAE